MTGLIGEFTTWSSVGGRWCELQLVQLLRDASKQDSSVNLSGRQLNWQTEPGSGFQTTVLADFLTRHLKEGCRISC